MAKQKVTQAAQTVRSGIQAAENKVLQAGQEVKEAGKEVKDKLVGAFTPTPEGVSPESLQAVKKDLNSVPTPVEKSGVAVLPLNAKDGQITGQQVINTITSNFPTFRKVLKYSLAATALSAVASIALGTGTAFLFVAGASAVALTTSGLYNIASYLLRGKNITAADLDPANLKNKATGLVEQGIDKAKGAAEKGKELVDEAKQEVKDAANTAEQKVEDLAEGGKNLIRNATLGTLGAFSAGFEKVTDVFKQGAEEAKAVFPLHNPLMQAQNDYLKTIISQNEEMIRLLKTLNTNNSQAQSLTASLPDASQMAALTPSTGAITPPAGLAQGFAGAVTAGREEVTEGFAGLGS